MLQQQHYWSSFFITIIYHYFIISQSVLSVSSVHCSSVTACCDTKKNKTFLHVHIQYTTPIPMSLFPFPFSRVFPEILPFAREFPFPWTLLEQICFSEKHHAVCPEERRGTRPRTTSRISQNIVIWLPANVCNSAITAKHGFHIRMHQKSFVGLGALCSSRFATIHAFDRRTDRQNSHR